MHDHAYILIWDAYMHMGHNIVPYVYGISHMCTGYPICLWDMSQYMHMAQNTANSIISIFMDNHFTTVVYCTIMYVLYYSWY